MADQDEVVVTPEVEAVEETVTPEVEVKEEEVAPEVTPEAAQ